MCTKNYDRMVYSSWDKVRDRRTDGRTDGQTDGKSDTLRWVPHLKIQFNLIYAHVTFSKWRLKSKYEKPRLKSIYLFLLFHFQLWTKNSMELSANIMTVFSITRIVKDIQTLIFIQTFLTFTQIRPFL